MEHSFDFGKSSNEGWNESFFLKNGYVGVFSVELFSEKLAKRNNLNLYFLRIIAQRKKKSGRSSIYSKSASKHGTSNNSHNR